jgi:hypothetical protein
MERSGECLEEVLKVNGRSPEVEWKKPRGRLKEVQKVNGRGLEGVWKRFSRGPVDIWKRSRG